jgi:hypothetical protein
MPQETDLVGVGMPFALAAQLGNQAAAVTCAGTSQATATTALTKLNLLTAASSQTGVVIGGTPLLGSPHYFATTSSTSAVVYAPVGHTLNGSASTSGLTVAQNKSALLIQTSLKNWYSILTA